MSISYFDDYYYEHKNVQLLKQDLLTKYKDKDLTEVIEGEIIEKENNFCYHIKTQDKIDFKTLNPDCAKEKILSNLRLIKGIGYSTELILKKMGYRTIADLTNHPRFGSEASCFINIIEQSDIHQMIHWIENWFQKSHPLILYSLGLQNKEDFVILDIETMGLFSCPIVLIGVAKISANNIVVDQYLARSIHEEQAALLGFLSHIQSYSIFITFNGRMFDIPFIQSRLLYYGILGDLKKPHIDVLYFSRRAWKKELPNCRLTTLEKHLFGLVREDDVPSALVPEFYKTYLKTNNVGPIIPIPFIEHNRQDLISLANILSKLNEM